MPVGKGRFRVVTRGGKKIRLHITPSGRVNEAKSLSSGKVHSSAEFAADRKRAAKRRRTRA
jgi:hypothetical protein